MAQGIVERVGGLRAAAIDEEDFLEKLTRLLGPHSAAYPDIGFYRSMRALQ